MYDFRRFHIVRLRAESQVSICMALANALALMASLVRMAAALVVRLTTVTTVTTVLVGLI